MHESMVTGEVYHRRVIVRFPTNLNVPKVEKLTLSKSGKRTSPV